MYQRLIRPINLLPGELRSHGPILIKIWNLFGKKSIRTNLKGQKISSISLQMAAVLVKIEFWNFRVGYFHYTKSQNVAGWLKIFGIFWISWFYVCACPVWYSSSLKFQKKFEFAAKRKIAFSFLLKAVFSKWKGFQKVSEKLVEKTRSL